MWHRLALVPITAVLAVGPGSPASAQLVTESFTSSDRTLKYQYDKDDLSASGSARGLMLVFHGHNVGNQEQVLDLMWTASQEFVNEARNNKLVPVILASPWLRTGPGESGPRHWWDADISLVQEFLQVRLPSRFSFDSNRVVFLGWSQGTCFLHDFIRMHGTDYRGGFYAGCGCINLNVNIPWNTPPDFKRRFRVLVQSTRGDHLLQESGEAFAFYNNVVGLNTWGDFSGEGGHCADGEVSPRDAIAWLLETDSPGRLDCEGAAAVARIGGQGSGDALWLSPNAAAAMPRDYAITTLAGLAGAFLGFSGDGGPASKARISATDVAIDAAGNVYVADTENHRVRRIDAAGVITTLAGTGEHGFSGDGGPAAEARLHTPYGVATDAAGNVYLADSGNHRVRRIDAAGVITTLAGTGRRGFSGDGGPAVEAQLRLPHGVAIDAAGNVYVADSSNNRVRRIDAAGVITTLAGTGRRGFSGDGGPAAEARLEFPTDVAADAAGNVYVADLFNQRVRRIDAAGVITTLAGTGERGFSGDEGPASEAQLFRPWGVATDAAGNVYVSDSRNHRVRRIDPAGLITTYAGTGRFESSGDGGPATEAGILFPHGVATDAAGNVYIVENSRSIRVVKPFGAAGIFNVPLGQRGEIVRLGHDRNGLVTLEGRPVFAGHEIATRNGDRYSLSQDDDGPIVARKLPERALLSVSASATGPPAVRKIRTVAGTLANRKGFSGDGGPATEARLYIPTGIATDAGGNVYVADTGNHRVRRIDSTGVITTFAGTGDEGFGGDGMLATEAQLNEPIGIATDAAGNVYVADSGNRRVRRIDLAGVITTFAGTGDEGFSGDDGPANEAQFYLPHGVATDAAGNVYVTDHFDDRVRRVDSAGVITTFAGTGERGLSGDGGPAVEARLINPLGIATDAGGNVYVVDSGNNRVRRIDPSGIITTFAGARTYGRSGHEIGEPGFSGDNGPAAEAQLNNPWDVATDAAGNVYVTDNDNQRVRRIDPAGVITTFAGTGTWGYSGDGGPATEAEFGELSGIATNAAGTVYIADRSLHVVRGVSGGAGARRVTVQLGSSGEERDFSLSHEGHVLVRGEPAFSGTRVATCDGNVYALHATASGDVSASHVAERQAIGLGDTRPVTLARDESGAWRIGNETVGIGHRHRVRADREYLLDFAEGRWRLATHAMRTVAGNPGVQEGILATAAILYSPNAVVADALGNVYVADSGNHRVRRISPSGRIETVAGTGERGFSGDGGPAAEAGLDSPSGVAADSVGNVYVADSGNHRVRRIGPSGRIETVAGTGERGFSGDGGSAAEARLDSPSGVAADAAGNVYVADAGNRRVRRIDLSGIITTAAKSGTPSGQGDGGLASEALFSNALGSVAIDGVGNVYVADRDHHRVRRIDPAGFVSTFAGTGEAGFGGDGGPAASAQLDSPTGLLKDAAGYVYVADAGNHRIRRIDPSGRIETVAGTGEQGFSGDGGPAAQARLDSPSGVAADAAGNVYVADAGNRRVRRIDLSGIITTAAKSGTPSGQGDGGLASEALFSNALGSVAIDGVGNVYVADRDHHRVRRIDPAGFISTFAGTGEAGFGGDGGPAASAQLDSPTGLATDSVGNVYVADSGNHRVRRIEPDGTITTLAGTGEAGYSGEDLAPNASMLDTPERVATDADGRVYVLDTGNRRVRIVSPDEPMRTVAGNGEPMTPWVKRNLFREVSLDELIRLPLAGATDLAVDPTSTSNFSTALHIGMGSPLGFILSWAVPLPIGRGPVPEPLFALANPSQLPVYLAHGGNNILYLVHGTRIVAIGHGEPRANQRITSFSIVADLSFYGASVGGMAVDQSGKIWFSDPKHRSVRVLEPVR